MPCTLCLLESLSVISISGADRLAFLQGQLTNDVRKLGGGLLTAGCCSPKGRLITVMRLFAEGETVSAVLPSDLLEAVEKRLRMYVFRSRVKISKEPGIKVLGFLGEEPGLPGKVFTLAGGTCETLEKLGIPSVRGMAFIDEKDVPVETRADEPAWWAAAACAGDPWVFAASRELFVPQGVNLDLAGGVSFSKGCYTGQEIVSRIHNIGRPSRRAALFAAAGPLEAGPGQALDDDAGTVVLSGNAPGGRAAILAQVPADRIGFPASLAGAALEPLPLPYSFGA